jgi:hypothetical protein
VLSGGTVWAEDSAPVQVEVRIEADPEPEPMPGLDETLLEEEQA